MNWFDKVSLKAASYQTADIVTVHTSKEMELKGFKTTYGWLNNKNVQEWPKMRVFVCFALPAHI